jgi:hypothetical protein
MRFFTFLAGTVHSSEAQAATAGAGATACMLLPAAAAESVTVSGAASEGGGAMRRRFAALDSSVPTSAGLASCNGVPLYASASTGVSIAAADAVVVVAVVVVAVVSAVSSSSSSFASAASLPPPCPAVAMSSAVMPYWHRWENFIAFDTSDGSTGVPGDGYHTQMNIRINADIYSSIA